MEWDDQIMDELLRNAVATPGNYPPGLWERIQKRRRVRRMRLPLLIAAVAAVLIACFVLIRPSHNSRPPQDYVKQVCVDKKALCNSPVFKELEAEMNASSVALLDIDKQLKLFGADEQLLRAKTRIEAHQARIVKAIKEIL